MIELTKLNKKKFVLNCEMIESLEATPDTVITLRNGKLFIVEETPDQVVELVAAFKRDLYAGAVIVREREAADPEEPAEQNLEETEE